MRESCTSGSVRGARGNSRPYRNPRDVRCRRARASAHRRRRDRAFGSNPILNLVAGDYTLVVDGTGDHTGSYAFRLLDESLFSPFRA
jgi:hypothetical protein